MDNLDLRNYRQYLCTHPSNLTTLIEDDSENADVKLSEIGLTKPSWDGFELPTNCRMSSFYFFSFMKYCRMKKPPDTIQSCVYLASLFNFQEKSLLFQNVMKVLILRTVSLKSNPMMGPIGTAHG